MSMQAHDHDRVVLIGSPEGDALPVPDGDASLLAGTQAQLSPDDPINIQYTSGTTGFPKGATLSHHNVVNNGYFVGEFVRLHRGRPDSEGYLIITGRIKDMVIRGGENVYPREIEEFLYTHPDLLDAQVPDAPRSGQPHGCLSLSRGHLGRRHGCLSSAIASRA